MDKDILEVMGCTCLRMRRATRRLTQVYDRVLEPAGLTANQFGLLAYLQGASFGRPDGLSIGMVAERVGMDPTTLNRNLKPLSTRGLVTDAADPADGRVRIVRITDKGRREWQGAVPLWREAQAQLEAAVGAKAVVALNELLDLSAARLAHAG